MIINSETVKKLSIDGDVIVMIDDDEDQTFLAKKCYEMSGRKEKLVLFPEGESFLAWMNDSPIKTGLIFLDINMPGLSGFEVLDKLNLALGKGRPPVIMLTASDSEDDISKAQQFGANGFWTKPGSVQGYIDVFSKV